MNKSLVLIIEDDVELNELLSEVVRACDYDVIQAHNGKEATELFGQNHIEPVLVLCDLKMPVMGGIDFIKHTIIKNLDLNICLMSGCNDKADIIQGLQLGVMGYINKPITIKILKEKLNLMMDIGKRKKEIKNQLKDNKGANISIKLNNLLKVKNSQNNA